MNSCCNVIRHSLIGILVGAALLSGFAFAAPAHHEARGERLAQALELNEQQRSAVEQAMQEHRALVAEINWRNEDGSVNADARAEMQAARAVLRSTIREQLDPAQAERFDAMAERMHQRGHHQGRGGHGPMRALSQLDLSEEQRDSVRQLLSAHRENQGLQRQQLHASLQEILTAEQLAELEQIRSRRGAGKGGHGSHD